MEAASPPPAGAAPDPQQASGGVRALGVLLAVAIGFAAAVIIAVMVDLGDGPLCEDVRSGPLGPIEDCWDLSPAQQVASLALGWPGAVVGVIAALAALVFAITGRGGRRAVLLSVGAVVLCGLSILVGSF